MARLTNDMRIAFVRAVMADLPHDPSEEKLTTALKAAYMKSIPKAVVDLFENEDTRGFIDYRHLQVYATEEGRYDSCAKCASVGPVPNNQRVAGPSFANLAEGNPELKMLHAEWYGNILRKESLRSALYATANGCSTVDKLRKALPELEKYMPDGPRPDTENLPTANTVAVILSELGWKEPEPAV
jgi:hypothetical protein